MQLLEIDSRIKRTPVKRKQCRERADDERDGKGGYSPTQIGRNRHEDTISKPPTQKCLSRNVSSFCQSVMQSGAEGVKTAMFDNANYSRWLASRDSHGIFFFFPAVVILPIRDPDARQFHFSFPFCLALHSTSLFLVCVPYLILTPYCKCTTSAFVFVTCAESVLSSLRVQNLYCLSIQCIFPKFSFFSGSASGNDLIVKHFRKTFFNDRIRKGPVLLSWWGYFCHNSRFLSAVLIYYIYGGNGLVFMEVFIVVLKKPDFSPWKDRRKANQQFIFPEDYVLLI